MALQYKDFFAHHKEKSVPQLVQEKRDIQAMIRRELENGVDFDELKILYDEIAYIDKLLNPKKKRIPEFTVKGNEQTVIKETIPSDYKVRNNKKKHTLNVTLEDKVPHEDIEIEINDKQKPKPRKPRHDLTEVGKIRKQHKVSLKEAWEIYKNS